MVRPARRHVRRSPSSNPPSIPSMTAGWGLHAPKHPHESAPPASSTPKIRQNRPRIAAAAGRAYADRVNINPAKRNSIPTIPANEYESKLPSVSPRLPKVCNTLLGSRRASDSSILNVAPKASQAGMITCGKRARAVVEFGDVMRGLLG